MIQLGGGWDTWVLPDGENYENSYASPTHSKHQLMEDNFSFLRGDGSTEQPYDAFKFKVPWCVATPPGYSSLYLDPFLHQNKYFRTWQGTMDTDMFNRMDDNTQVIVYPLHNKSFVITKGTPILQIVPYRREQWTASYMNMDGSAYISENSHITSSYKCHQFRNYVEWKVTLNRLIIKSLADFIESICGQLKQKTLRTHHR